MTPPFHRAALALALALAVPAAGAAPQLTEWPRIHSPFAPDPALERRVARIVGQMTLAQKIGQMTQAEIKSASPADVRTYYLGSVLNGGGSWPGNDKHAGAADWLALADAYYAASMATDMPSKVPLVWGTDAVHGHNNVYGATLFPHNIGLGAARDPKLVEAIGAATARAVRATGIAWVFAPTLAVVRDIRWGRTYESFAEDPALVREYGAAYVRGMQGVLRRDANAIATAKHFIGDGGTDQGKDRGVNKATLEQMINIHGQGYYGALGAGAQTVMASFNSWSDVAAGQDYGKMHGSGAMLGEVLKHKMGFDGFVVSDWNGIAEVPGCRVDSCAQAINAGIDMVMAPDDWKAFIANTIADVDAGRIAMSRIDDAVSRIIRVKLRAGLFDKRPSANAFAGKDASLQARALARRAVRESLVLLKNEGPALPLAARRILVVGTAADSVPHQTGGWSLTWQGTGNANADFPNADTVLAGIRSAAGAANVSYSPDGNGVDLSQFDAVVAVLGERPYAEGDGDIGPAATLRHSSRYPEDLALLQAVHGKGVPVVTVFMSGRPLWVNDLLNLSDSFVAAWLPGTEGKGVADLLILSKGRHAYEFTGTLPFAWPRTVCQATPGDGGKPLFAYGFGLKRGMRSHLGQVDAAYPSGGCGTSNSFPVFGQADRASFPLSIRTGAQAAALGTDLNASYSLPGITVSTAQINTQQDAKLVHWNGPATFEARGSRALALPSPATAGAALRFDTMVQSAPAGRVTLGMLCEAPGCGTPLDATRLFARIAGQGKQVVKIPLACFTARGVDLSRVTVPFSVGSSADFAAAFGNIDIVTGAARDADAVHCEELQ